MAIERNQHKAMMPFALGPVTRLWYLWNPAEHNKHCHFTAKKVHGTDRRNAHIWPED